MTAVLERIPSWAYVVGVLAALLVWEFVPLTAERRVNPEVLHAIESIAALCSEELQPGERRRCEHVQYLIHYCSTRGKGTCSVSRYYEMMVTWGFKMPPLYVEER